MSVADTNVEEVPATMSSLLALGALRTILRAVPDMAHQRAFAALSSRVLGNLADVQQLQPIEGRRLRLMIVDTANIWSFRVEQGRLLATPTTSE